MESFADDAALLGREADLGLILSHRAGPLLLLGDPGVGKSALLEAAAADAAAAGTRVLRAAGMEYETQLSYAGIRQLFDAADAALPTDAVAEALLTLLNRLAERRPTLLVIDDLQWLDSASATVLGQVARQLSGTATGMICASRPGAESYFDRHGLPVHDVVPLNDVAAEALLARHFPAMAPQVRQRLMAEAQGNPLALLELPVALSDPQRAAVHALPERLPLSRRLQTAFASRITGLPAATRYLLLLAALDGTGDLQALWRAVDGRCSPKHLAPAERAQLVYVDEPSRLRFRHSLTRSAVVELATDEQRHSAHEALAQAWHDVPERRVWHLAQAVDTPDEQVAALVEQEAGTIASRGDGPAAVAALLRAAELSPAGADRAQRLAHAAYLSGNITGDLHDVPRLLEDAWRAAPGDGCLTAAAAGSTFLLNGTGDIDTAHGLLCGAIETQIDSYDPTDPIWGYAFFTLMLVCFFGGRVELWRKLDAVLGRVREAPALTRLCRSTLGDPARATAADLAELDAAIAQLVTDENERITIPIATAGTYVDRLGNAAVALHRVVAAGRRGDNVAPTIRALFLLGIDAWMTGQWPQARQCAQEAVDLCEQYRYPILAAPPQYVLGVVAAARGEYEQADELADRIEQWAGPRRADAVTRYAAHIRFLSAMGQGDPEEAYQQASLIAPAGSLPPFEPQALWAVLDLVDAAVRTGRRAEAAAHVAAARADRIDALSPRLRMLTHAAAALAAEDEAEARSEFERALSVEGAERWPFYLARVRLYYGERLRRDRSVAEAKRHLSAASDAFGALGAVPWAERAGEELRACGGTSGRVPARPVAAVELTPQQLEIARLAAAGLTNKQIGEKLYLSPRTVSSHLHQLFPKLGISSRAALRDALDTSND